MFEVLYVIDEDLIIMCVLLIFLVRIIIFRHIIMYLLMHYGLKSALVEAFINGAATLQRASHNPIPILIIFPATTSDGPPFEFPILIYFSKLVLYEL